MIRSLLRRKPAGTAAAPNMTDTTGGQDVSVMFVTLAGMAALTLVIQGLLAWMLLPEGRGAYAVCIVFGMLLGLVLTPGIAQGTQYFVAARQISVSQAVSSAFVIGLGGGGLAAALAIPLIYSDIAFFQKAETHTFLLALALAPLTAISVALDHQLVAHRRFSRLAAFSLLRVVVNVLALAVLVWRLDLGVDGALVAFAAGHGTLIATCLLDLRRHCGLALELPRRPNFTHILGYGLKYHVARIGDVVELQIGIVMLGLIASQSEIGLFSAASTLMLGFILISNAVGNPLLPRIAGAENSELVARCLRLVCVVTAICMLLPLALSTPAVRLLLSEAFLPAVPLLWIIAPGILALAGSGILMTHFKGANVPEVCSWAVFLGLSANVGALLLLYPALGVKGAAWAMTTGMVCRFLLLSIMFHRATRMDWPSIWLPRRSDASFLWAEGRALLARGAGGGATA